MSSAAPELTDTAGESAERAGQRQRATLQESGGECAAAAPGPGGALHHQGLKVHERIRCRAGSLQRHGIVASAAIRGADDGRSSLQHQRVVAVAHCDRRADIALHNAVGNNL
jgi:hypothetical protein